VAAPDFQAWFQSSPGLYLVLTPDLRIVGASDAYLRATMTAREAILGRDIFDVFPDNPADPEAKGVQNLRTSLERVLKTREADAMPVQKYDVRRPDAEGGGFVERYWSPLNSPVCGADGEVTYIIHRVEDVTEFIRLKQYGREREQIAKTLQNCAVQMEAEIFARAQQVGESNRQLTQANDALARLYDRIALLLEHADDQLRTGQGSGDNWEDNWDEMRNTIDPEAMLARIGQLIVGHKELEAQLLQSQKMEAVGRLAGGVAHDFNNLLTVIGGYTAMLLEDPANAVALPDLEEIERAVVRAKALTDKLLAFSRKQILQPQIIDLAGVVRGMEGMLSRLIGETIQLVTITGSGVAVIKADPYQIEQVIMNLAINARDAMPVGGRITIETGNTSADTEFRSLRPGNYVWVSVTDTGQGMDAEIAARVFEPFFTTKERGKGTGLGLSTVYGIVEQSGGTVTVESAPGAGSTFRVYLPQADAIDQPEVAERSAGPRVARSGTVLLIEDEAELRRLISKALAAGGHHVLPAVSGEEALALAAGPQPIDVVLTDVIMPGMSGPELIARLRPLRPDCAVLYMSGYDHELIDQKELERTASFLPKPFTPRVLLTRINELLRAQRREDASAGGAGA
jgi:signal transduction histidine kinase/CheY-like chemotaxis protein